MPFLLLGGVPVSLFVRLRVQHCLTLALLAAVAVAQTAEQKTARYFDSVRKQPSLLLAFLHDMPKGGDLHNHLAGAIYAEDLIDFAASDNLCVDRTTSRLIAPPCDSCEKYTAKPAIRCAYDDQILYNQIIDAWSMRNWRPGDESGHDHFFATFGKFSLDRPQPRGGIDCHRDQPRRARARAVRRIHAHRRRQCCRRNSA